MRRISLLLALVASLFITPALADFTGKDASLATITFKNPGACASVVCVPVFQLYDGTNVVTLTTAGADAVSNTLTGLPTYSRGLVFNGTTWDRWTGAVTVAGVATASNQTTINTSIGTTNTNLGAQADAAAAADNSTASLIALLKRTNQNLTTVSTTAAAATPAGTNLIGKVGIDQTTPGTTNLVALAANQSVNVAQFGGVSTATGQVAVSTAPVTATNTALVTALRPDSPGIIALGQTTKSASVPVAIASDQVGTAGTAAANVLTVQGIASMTKLLVTPDSVALPANQSVNVAQVNGVATSTGTGAVGTGTQRVAVGTDTATIAGSAPGTAGTPSANIVSVQGAASMTPIVANGTNGYPSGAIAETISAVGTTAATTATLATGVGKTTYICGFSIRANATAAATANSTVTGTITGTLNFTQWTAPLASGIGLTEQRFSPCVPASATNTSIAVVSAPPGSGGTVSVTAWGFQL